MDIAFFDRLTDAEAQAYLDRYLEVEATASVSTLADAAAAGISVDHSLDSIGPFFLWLVEEAGTVPPPAHRKRPRWPRRDRNVRRSPSDPDDGATSLVLRASYYLGTSFVRTFPSLRWATGREGIAEHNMPVVAGFASGDELAPILVAEDAFRRAVRTGERDHMQAMVDTWKRGV